MYSRFNLGLMQRLSKSHDYFDVVDTITLSSIHIESNYSMLDIGLENSDIPQPLVLKGVCINCRKRAPSLGRINMSDYNEPREDAVGWTKHASTPNAQSGTVARIVTSAT